MADNELTLAEIRRLGGLAVKEKYGNEHFKNLNKLSQKSKKDKKNETESK